MRGRRVRVALDEALTAGLKALARRHGATLFMTLLAGWAAVLSRLSGQDDVVVGTPSANRGRAEIEGLIGFFVNTLALRVDLSGSPTVAELLARVRERALAAQQHQDIPFEQVVERVDPARSLSHSPLFQVVFAWVNAPLGAGISLPGLELDAVVTGASQAKFDLSLTLQEAGDRIAGGVEYATALFERATVERWLGYLRRVLEAMAEDERQAVDRLPLLSPAERRQVVEEWNATEAEYPAESCIHELFERAGGAHARRHGGALRGRAPELRGAERAGQPAGAPPPRAGRGAGGAGGPLRGARPGMVAAVLAVLKAGRRVRAAGPRVPARPPGLHAGRQRPGRRADAARGGGALAGVLDGLGGGVPVLELDAAAPAWASQRETNPARGGADAGAPGVRDLHLRLHRPPQGRDGAAPGARATSRPRSSARSAWARTTGCCSSPRSASTRRPAELVMAAGVGRRARPWRPARSCSPGRGCWRSCARTASPMVHAVPRSALAALPVEALPALRHAHRWPARRFPRSWPAPLGRPRHRLWNLYGPTEATIWSTAAECADAGARAGHRRRRSPTPRAYVLDPALEPLPVGGRGRAVRGRGRGGARLPGPAGAHGRSASFPTRSAGSRARACTARATGCAGWRTAGWSSSAAWTTR